MTDAQIAFAVGVAILLVMAAIRMDMARHEGQKTARRFVRSLLDGKRSLLDGKRFLDKDDGRRYD